MAKVRYKEPSENFKKSTMNQPDAKQRSSVGSEGYVGEFYNFSIDLLIPYAKQARKRFDESRLQNLLQQLKKTVLKTPFLLFLLRPSLKSLRLYLENAVFALLNYWD